MYTKEKLNSNSVTRFYENVARKVLCDISFFEQVACRDGKKRNLKMNIDDKSFECLDDKISYSGFLQSSSDGHYLSVAASKTLGNDLIDVILCKGVCGFDLATGEKYDRRLAQVRYSYQDGRADVKSVMDEHDLTNEEEKRLEVVSKSVLEMKRTK